MGTTKTRADNIRKLKRWLKTESWAKDHLLAMMCLNFDVSLRLAKEYLKVLVDTEYVRLEGKKVIPVKWQSKK